MKAKDWINPLLVLIKQEKQIRKTVKNNLKIKKYPVQILAPVQNQKQFLSSNLEPQSLNHNKKSKFFFKIIPYIFLYKSPQKSKKVQFNRQNLVLNFNISK